MIGEKIKTLRKKKGITIAEASKIFSVAPRTYSSYEAEEREPNIEMINRLADFYGVTTDYLLGREPAPNPFAGVNITVDNKKFIDIYQELPEYQQKLLVDAMIKLGASAQQGNDITQSERHESATGELLDEEQAEETDAG